MKIHPYYTIPFWNDLPDDDKSEYKILHESFRQHHMHPKGNSFQNDLRNLLGFTFNVSEKIFVNHFAQICVISEIQLDSITILFVVKSPVDSNK